MVEFLKRLARAMRYVVDITTVGVSTILMVVYLTISVVGVIAVGVLIIVLLVHIKTLVGG